MERSKKIMRAGVLGIAVNLLLVVFKAAVGFAAGSVAILLDAVNNLSDVLSAGVTIIGTKLAGKAPDKKHPFGHGRVEYLTAMIIAVIILAAGGTALVESVQKILSPSAAAYSVLSLVIIAVAVLVKVALGFYVRRVGKNVHAETLVGAGTDALFDAVLSFSTLIGALFSYFRGINIEGYLGVLIGLFILKAGFEILSGAVASIIGMRPDATLAAALRERVLRFPEVRGVYDMTLHNYGPSRVIGSIHVEVPDEMTAREIHRLTRAISTDIYMELGVVLTVGIYASQNSSAEAARIRDAVDAAVAKHPDILQLHGFYADEAQKTITFDLVIDFKADAAAIKDEVTREVSSACPGYTVFAVLDSDYGD